MKPTVVLVDDEDNILDSLKRCLRAVDAHVEAFNSPIAALEYCKNNKPTLVISDQRMPLLMGSELLKEIKQLDDTCQCFLLSAYNDFDDITLAFNQGIIDRYISKPWDIKEIRYHVDQALKKSQGETSVKRDKKFHNIIAQCDKMFEVFDYVRRAASSNVPIFIHGETGTGKELIAKACHLESYRKDQEFVAVNCANFSETLIESQLFGHKKGSFTGATNDQEGLFGTAQGGTLFLDEVTTIPISLQSKLLRVIQEREYSPLGSHKLKQFDVQIVTASSLSLSDAVEEGVFREDLFYRLNVIYIHLPPLHERGGDIELIASYYLAKFNKEANKSIVSFSEDAKNLMHDYHWPGNIRQLENLIHSSVILNDGVEITANMLSSGIQFNKDSTSDFNRRHENQVNESVGGALMQSDNHHALALPANDIKIQPLWVTEKIHIEAAIDQCGGNVSKAAELLEISPSTIYRKQQSWKT